MRQGLLRYSAHRALLAIPVLLGVTFVTFLLVHITPGNPARLELGPTASQADVNRLYRQLGLNLPWPEQYGKYLLSLSHGNLGTSLSFQQPVLSLIVERLPVTLLLTFGAFVLSVLVSVPLGLIAAVRRGRPSDMGVRLVALLGVCAPSFWLALILILVFAVDLKVFPAEGLPAEWGFSAFQHLFLPCLSLAIAQVALSAGVRASMLEVMGMDYMATARAKALSPFRITVVHGLRNAMLPVITILGLQIATLLGGAVITENVFALPGVGSLAIQAVNAKDYPLVQGIVLLAAVAVIVMSVLVDISYVILNPRVALAHRVDDCRNRRGRDILNT